MKRCTQTFAVRDSRAGELGEPRIVDVGDLYVDADPLVAAYPEFFEDVV